MSFPDAYLLWLELRNNPIEFLWLIGAFAAMWFIAKWLDSIEYKRRKSR